MSVQIGFEIWTMQSDILFDNIYIGHSIEDAHKLQVETYDIKSAIEKAEEDAAKPKEPEKPLLPTGGSFKDDPITYVKERFNLFVTLAKQDPFQAAKVVPEVAGVLGVAVGTLLAVLLGVLGGSAAASSPQVQKAVEKTKENAAIAKDKVAAAASSGAEKVQAEVNKRTTRSSGAAVE